MLSMDGGGKAPNIKARFESTFVGKDPTILLNPSSSSYTTFPNFDTESGETTRFMASSNCCNETGMVGKNTVRSYPNTRSTNSGMASCTANIPRIADRYPVTAWKTCGPTGSTASFPDNGSRTTDEKQDVVAALGSPARTITLGRRTPRPSQNPRRE